MSTSIDGPGLLRGRRGVITGCALVILGCLLVVGPLREVTVLPLARVSLTADKVTKESLGSASWTLIHTLAANYPPAPSEAERKSASAFVTSIATLYPCKVCRDHFDRFVAVVPPDVTNRERFLIWTCRAHNEVNKRNGKKEFPCELKELDERWGDCGCNDRA